MPYRNLPILTIQRKTNGRLVPSVSGGKSAAGQIEAVAECLLDNLGRAVSYKRLVNVIGRKSDNPTSRHLLRQYISVLTEVLLESNSPTSSRSLKRSVTVFAKSQTIRAIVVASEETRARRRWGEMYGTCARRPA